MFNPTGPCGGRDWRRRPAAGRIVAEGFGSRALLLGGATTQTADGGRSSGTTYRWPGFATEARRRSTACRNISPGDGAHRIEPLIDVIAEQRMCGNEARRQAVKLAFLSLGLTNQRADGAVRLAERRAFATR